MKSRLKLGTRRSLLAWAQSSWVAREVERLNPGTEVELVGIDTRGDKILDVALTGIEGKEFFVAELDDALRSGRVDLTVHSMKDLSLDRPREFVLGANPRRENPRDAILFGPGILDKLRAGKTIRIGTSSPRRLENIPSFLESALPQLAGKPRLEFLEIRGNVNTRLSRVHEPAGSPKQLDAVVLAFAGLIRLAADEKAWIELQRLLVDVRWMILPLEECPAAPAQGALAVECRADAAGVRAALARLHDAETGRRVGLERQLLADWGGGCHQKFGATCVSHAEAGDLLFIRGRKPDGEFVEELRWQAPAAASAGDGAVRAWDGNQWRGAGDVERLSSGKLEGIGFFIAHSRALAEAASLPSGARVWTSGTPSWKRLAAAGVWVEGCAEGLGFGNVQDALREKVLSLPPFKEWSVLTHADASEGWDSHQKVVPTYCVRISYGSAARAALQQATHVYWSSGSQYDGLNGLVPPGARHACGPGKTAAHLRRAGLDPVVFPAVEEWRKWLKI